VHKNNVIDFIVIEKMSMQ